MADVFKSFYKTVGGNEGNKCHYPTRLDTYGCGCNHDCKYCVDPDTRVFMFDGTQRRIDDVCIGDTIYGVVKDGRYHKFSKSVVTNKHYVVKEAYKITLSNGQTLICSDNHRWLSNRGWKYTTGAMSGVNQRPYLTNKVRLLGFSSFIEGFTFEENDLYKRGYLCGIIRGDGSLVSYTYPNPLGGKNQYHFRLVMKSYSAVSRCKDYLEDFGVVCTEFDFPMVDRSSKLTINTVAIRTHKKDDWFAIQDLISFIDDYDFYRGFIAGIYDAEGSKDSSIKRIFNSDIAIVDFCEKALKSLEIPYVFDKDKVLPSGKLLKTIRIIGGLDSFFRLVQLCNFATDKFSFVNAKLKNMGSLQVVSVEKLNEGQQMVDITTTTENFIANGVVSHNCYAKSLLDFRKLWHPEEPAVADIQAIHRKLKTLVKNGEVKTLRLGGMTDCFQPCEKTHRVTYKTIQLLNEYRIPYLIVTKSAIIGDDDYLEVLDKDLAHIQVTVTTTDDELSKTYEKASVPSDRMKAIGRLYDNGFDVQLRLSPFIPQYVDLDKLAEVNCDKILVEFLRVNTWIKRWFDIDYSEYTVKQGGYQHLPLVLKRKYISQIHGFKEITVCEDETEAYEYWRTRFNPNKDDCCNLRRSL